MTSLNAAEQSTRLEPAAVSASAVIGREDGAAAARGKDFVDPRK
jgi:hypothetical protein